MQVTHAGFVSDGTVLGVAAVVWVAATAWIMDAITGSLYDAALAVIKTAATVAGH